MYVHLRCIDISFWLLELIYWSAHSQKSYCLFSVECIILRLFLQISAMFEYGAIMKVKVEFREVAIAPSNRQAGQFSFACECEVAGKRYPQGVGNTKKKAKTEAARIAMDTILEQGLPVAGEQP